MSAPPPMPTILSPATLRVYATALWMPSVTKVNGDPGVASASGTWSCQELAQWQHDAGLEPRKPIRLRTSPDAVIQAAVKPG